MTGRRMIDRWMDDSKSLIMQSMKVNVLSTLYGGIIGDLLGVPVEFRKRDTFHIQDIEGYGTYNQPPGTWSDDSSMTLCLVENIVEEGSLEDLMNRFVQYKEHGYWTPYDKMFDIGRTTVEAIDRFKEGMIPENCGGYSEYDNGNGALMRISPLAFLMLNEFDFVKKAELIKHYSQITHRHPRSTVGSIIYIELLLRMYHNNSFETSLQQIQNLFNTHFKEDHLYHKELKNYKRIFTEEFFDLPVEDIKSDGYVVHTLEAAIWCLGTTTSYKEAVLKAVNLGEDTDTVASITGSLAGMHYKMEGIPEEWIAQIARKQDVDELIQKFYKHCANKEIIKEYGSL